MTYSIVACLPEEGLVGIAVATSPPAIGSRTPWLAAGVGAVASQGNTDPALGSEALALLDAGRDPATVLASFAGRRHWATRQVGLIDRQGRSAAHTGDLTEPEKGHRTGRGYAVQGNHLASPQVLPAMEKAWLDSDGQLLESRLLAALIAGRDAGGDKSGTRSSALRVMAGGPNARTDLRVDWQDDAAHDAVDELGVLLALWQPLIAFYERRPNEPDLGSWEDWRGLR